MKDDMIGSQVIILGERAGERAFPIFIGYNEAFALDMTLHGFKNERPMRRDLIYYVIEGVGAGLHSFVIDDLQSNTFFGKLAIRSPDGSETLIDSRPSDAIVLATKRRLPIFVSESVLERVIRDDQEEE